MALPANQPKLIAGRKAMAAQYYAAMLGYPTSIGGGYWWAIQQQVP